MVLTQGGDVKWPIADGGDDSDVYVLHTGVWVTYVGNNPSEETIAKLGGSSFQDKTPGECLHRLLNMRKEGLLIPQYGIDRLRREDQQLTQNGFISPR